jgi:NTP pyrophosphatase (non-canonical NTP hydrolase)
MNSWMLKLMDMIERNYLYDPWIDGIDLDVALKTVEEEIEEIRKAMKNEDRENLEEEIGDLLWTTFIVFLVALKKGLNAEKIISKLEEKMRRRKPYIFENYKPTIDEAIRIWRKAKNEESE